MWLAVYGFTVLIALLVMFIVSKRRDARVFSQEIQYPMNVTITVETE